jgi:hypothetical protein
MRRNPGVYVCLHFAQLDRPHEGQYIALHKKRKLKFCNALDLTTGPPPIGPFAIDFL